MFKQILNKWKQLYLAWMPSLSVYEGSQYSVGQPAVNRPTLLLFPKSIRYGASPLGFSEDSPVGWWYEIEMVFVGRLVTAHQDSFQLLEDVYKFCYKTNCVRNELWYISEITDVEIELSGEVVNAVWRVAMYVREPRG